MTLLVIGESLIDVVEHADGTLVEHPGGSPFNVARGASRLGLTTELATQLAPDDRGDLLRHALEADGVAISAEPAPLPHTSTAHATLNASGAATYRFDITWDPGTLPDPAGFEAVHIGSLGAFLEPGATAVAELVLMADLLGIPVSLDPNIRLGVSADHDAWNAAFARVCGHAGIIKMSDEDAAVLGEDQAPASVAAQLSMEGALVVVTCGSEGAFISQNGRIVEVAAPSIEVADTIGAGDSYMAAMLAWFAMYHWPGLGELDDTELRDLGQYAAHAAAITVSRPGADPPHIQDL